MRVSIENIVARCNVHGDMDLEEISNKIEGSRYQKDVMDGIIYRMKEPECDIFLLGDGMIKVHGLTNLKDVQKAVSQFGDRIKSSGIDLEMDDECETVEVVASTKIDPIDPKLIYDTFREDGIVYNPQELPGFILRMGKENTTVLIFPSGKIVCKGAKNMGDAVSAIDMVVEALKD